MWYVSMIIDSLASRTILPQAGKQQKNQRESQEKRESR